MKWPLLLCVLAGCFSDAPGLHIVVHDETGRAVSVDMYIAVKERADVTAMTPKNAPASMKGSVFILDADRAPTSFDVHDGEVVFNIIPKNVGDPLAVRKVMFIGRDANHAAVSWGELDALSLKAGDSTAYRFDMQEVASSTANPSDSHTPAGTRIYEWSHDDNAKLKCVDVEFADSDPMGTVIHDFFVPPDDTDCDGAMECSAADEFVYSTLVPPPLPEANLDNVTCAARETVDGDSLCHLGVDLIDVCDATGVQVCTAFTDEKFCAPLSVCANSGCFGQPTACFGNPTTASAVSSYLDCVIQVAAGGAGCMASGGSSAPVPLAEQFGSAFGLAPFKCAGAQVWRPGKALSPPDPDASTFVQPSNSASARFSISPSPTALACTFTLVYEGGIDTFAEATGGIDVQLAMNQHLIVPVRARFTSTGCATPSQCNFIADPDDRDAFKDCLEP